MRMPIPIVPDFFIIYITNMERSTAFYRDVLDLPVVFSSPGWTEFNTGSTKLGLHLTSDQTPEQPPLPPAGQAHLSFVVDDVWAAYTELQGKGAHFSLPPSRQPTSGLLVAVMQDPDGFGITLSSPLPAKYRGGG